MRFQVVTLFPELIAAGAGAGLLGQAVKKGLLSVSTIQPRDFATDAHRSVDDRPFGGGDGMIMMPEVLEACVARARADGPGRVVYLSPQGKTLTDVKVRELAREKSVILLCGRYGGIDQRAINELVDEEISIGDYVLSGGELPAMVLIEAVSRMLPGVLGHGESAEKDSFADGLLEHPNFTRPREWRGQTVPEALLSGHHGRIEEWKKRASQLASLKKRPDLFARLSEKERAAAFAFWKTLSEGERRACGFESLAEDDFGRF